jgi:20S proteasome alpha/beta subunit
MSFYIGFVTENLIALAADRKFAQGNKSFTAQKIKQLNKDTWGVHIGAKFFGERWLFMLSRIKPKSSILSTKGLTFISRFINWHYLNCQKKLRKRGLNLEGFTNIVVAGFNKNNPFIYTMDSKDKFHPVFCGNGSYVYSRIEENLTGIDEYIKKAVSPLGSLQEDSINKQKYFIRAQLQKIFILLGAKYEHISKEFDLVFITQGSSILEAVG